MSSNCDGVHVPAVWPLNKEPSDGCFVTITLPSSVLFAVRISASPTWHIHWLYSLVDVIMMYAYSPAGRYIGDRNVNVVGTVPSDDMLTWSGFSITLPFLTIFLEGYPLTTLVTLNSIGTVSDFVAKKKSTDVIKMPGSSSTKNVCARGSSSNSRGGWFCTGVIFVILLVIFVILNTTGSGITGGAGSVLSKVVSVMSVPSEKWSAEALEILRPGYASCGLRLAKSAVLVPFSNLFGGM